MGIIIDYFQMRRDSQLRMKDIKVVRTAEIQSDHHLVLMNLTRKSKAGIQENVKMKSERQKDRGMSLGLK